MSRKTVALRLCLTALLTVALLLGSASTAFALTGDPTLGLEALRQKLDDAGGSLEGYIRTVVKGSKIETFTVEILAINGDSPSSSLIMFDSHEMYSEFGGIVSGMSGSPVYVEDGGVNKVIGALSYGDMFTRSGYGLATPIEAMIRMTADYSPGVTMLDRPINDAGRTIDRVIISDDPSALQNVAAVSALVARDLQTVFIGGLRPSSAPYRRLAASLRNSGLAVFPVDAPLSAGNSAFSTDFDPGSGLAVLATRGDLWVGGLGTATWSDGSTVLAFGHPAFLLGDTSLYMCNAWIDGVWPSNYMPYKIGIPTAVRGTITQDRDNGIMGEIGAIPVETPITATVTSGSRVATSAAWVSSRLLDTGQIGNLASSVAYTAGAKMYGAVGFQGSADTTTTVHVSVGGDDYTATMVNTIDSGWDVLSSLGWDADLAVSEIQSVLSEGYEQFHITSVDVEASLSTERRYARIVGVSLDEPLHEGDNDVTVSMWVYGIAATQTVETVLTVPEGTPLNGNVVARGAYYYVDPYMMVTESGSSGPTVAGPRPSVAGSVDMLNSMAPGDSFTVSLVSNESLSSGALASPISVTETSPWVTGESASTAITQLTAQASPSAISYGDLAMVTGEIYGPARSVPVKVYGIPEGSSGPPTLLAEADANYADGMLTYEIMLDGLEANTTLMVAVDGSSDFTPAEATAYVEVRAKVALSSSKHSVRLGRHVTLTAKVTPASARGPVVFQYWETIHRHWRSIGTRFLHGAGSVAHAQIDWAPIWGDRKVRAVYGGTASLGGATSTKITVHVR